MHASKLWIGQILPSKDHKAIHSPATTTNQSINPKNSGRLNGTKIRNHVDLGLKT